MVLKRDFIHKADSYMCVIRVILQQDMRGRFSLGSYFGYVLTILWPLSHLLFLTFAFILRVEIAPFGESPALFVATGAMPYIVCFYPARMMCVSISENRQLLSLPIIRPLHLMAGRCILEMINASIVLFIFCLGAISLGVEIAPVDYGLAYSAIMAALAFGIGLGFFNAVMIAIVGGFYMIFFVLSFAALYLTAGVYVPVSALPENYRSMLEYNPLYVIVQWMRSAYYPSLDLDDSLKMLPIFLAFLFLALGLAGERFVRGKF